MSVNRLVLVRGFRGDGATAACRVQWLADADVSTDSNSTSLVTSLVTARANDMIMWNTGAQRKNKV
jgi:hypothetical protein